MFGRKKNKLNGRLNGGLKGPRSSPMKSRESVLEANLGLNINSKVVSETCTRLFDCECHGKVSFTGNESALRPVQAEAC